MTKITSEIESEILKRWHSSEYPTIIGVGNSLGLSEGPIRRVLRKNGIRWETSFKNSDTRLREENLQLIQDVIAPKKIKNYRFEGDAVITADYHNPCARLDLVDAVIKEAKKMQRPRQLFIVGDYFNFDVLSYWSTKKGGSSEDVKLENELMMGRNILLKFSKVFDCIYHSKGNHEDRWIEITHDSPIAMDILLKYLEIPNLSLIDSYYFYLDNIRVTHPKNYRQVKLSMASRLCDIHRCDVIQAHGHFGSIGFSAGGYRAVDLPTMADAERINYMNKADTSYPVWNNGFIVYKNKQILLKAKGFGL